MLRLWITIGCSLFLVSAAAAQDGESPLAKYGKLSLPAPAGGLDWTELNNGWKDRVAAEFEVINNADLPSLRTALKDKRRYFRAMAARALGIRGDKVSADALADLAQNDAEYMVRIRAVESLGLLKVKPAVITAVKKDRHAAVSWAADLAWEVFNSKFDCRDQMRRAFAVGIERKEMDVAQVGKPAPDFTAQTLDGKPFKLSSVLGKKPIAIYFAAFDQ